MFCIPVNDLIMLLKKMDILSMSSENLVWTKNLLQFECDSNEEWHIL